MPSTGCIEDDVMVPVMISLTMEEHLLIDCALRSLTVDVIATETMGDIKTARKARLKAAELRRHLSRRFESCQSL